MRLGAENSKLRLVCFLGLGWMTPLFAMAQCPNNPSLTPTVWHGGTPGNAAYAGGVYTVSGTGSYSNGQFFETGFADLTTLAGNGQIIAEVTAVSGNKDADEVAGIFIRGDTSSGADGGFLWIRGSSSSQYQFAARVNDGPLSELQSGTCSLPFWLRLQNSGDVLYPAVSTNGSTWTLLPALDMTSVFDPTDNLAYGLVVWSGSDSQPTTALFGNVCLNSSFTPYPTLTPGATQTPTPTFDSTVTSTTTSTPIPTSTATFTATNSFTPTGTITPVAPTPTPVPTLTPPPGLKAWPDPFTPQLPSNSTTHFLLPPGHGAGKVMIADLNRKLIWSLGFGAGADVQWDGKDMGGRIVASGVYLYLLESDGQVRRGTVTVMR
jgi:hypothetical protein